MPHRMPTTRGTRHMLMPRMLPIELRVDHTQDIFYLSTVLLLHGTASDKILSKLLPFPVNLLH